MTIIDAGKAYVFGKTTPPANRKLEWIQLTTALKPYGGTREVLYGNHISFSSASSLFVSTPKTDIAGTFYPVISKLVDDQTVKIRELYDAAIYDYNATGLYGSSLSNTVDPWMVTTGTNVNNQTNKALFWRKDQFAWMLQQTINTVGTDEYRENAISGDGNTAFVAKYTSADAYVAVDVYVCDGTTWSYQATLTPSNYAGNRENFGKAISTSQNGNVVAIGAPNFSLSQPYSSVYIFTRTGTAWSEQTIINQPITSVSFRFGMSVSMNSAGTKIAIGDSMAEEAYTYTGSGASWTLDHTFSLTTRGVNPLIPPLFGATVALSGDGNILAIGATEATSDIASGDSWINNTKGCVEVYRVVSSAWRLEDTIVGYMNDYDGFGSGLATNADGSVIFVGAPKQNTPNSTLGADIGCISIFCNQNYQRSDSGHDGKVIPRPLITIKPNKRYYNPRAEETITFTVEVTNDLIDSAQVMTNLRIMLYFYQFDVSNPPIVGLNDTVSVGTLDPYIEQAQMTISTNGSGAVSSVQLVDGGYGYSQTGTFNITNTLAGVDPAIIGYTVSNRYGEYEDIKTAYVSHGGSGYTPNQTNVPVNIADAPRPQPVKVWTIPSLAPGETATLTRTGTLSPISFGINPSISVRFATSDQIPINWTGNGDAYYKTSTVAGNTTAIGSNEAVTASANEFWSKTQYNGDDGIDQNAWDNGHSYALTGGSDWHHVGTISNTPWLVYNEFIRTNDAAAYRQGIMWQTSGLAPTISPTGRFVIYNLRDSPWIFPYQRNVVGYIRPSWEVPFPNPTDIPNNFAHHIAISPDGNYMAYCENSLGGLKLYKRIPNTLQWELMTTQPTNLPNGHARYASWSDDGTYLAVAASSSSYAWYCWKLNTTNDTWTDLTYVTRMNGSNAGSEVKFARSGTGGMLLSYGTFSPVQLYASSSAWVNSTNDTLNTEVHSTGVYVLDDDATGQHYLETGDIAYITNETYNWGLGLTSTYKWVRKIDAYTISFYNTQADAIADTNKINLTAVSQGNPRYIYHGATGTFTSTLGGGLAVYWLDTDTDTFSDVALPSLFISGQTHANFNGVGGNGTFVGGTGYSTSGSLNQIYLQDGNFNSQGTRVTITAVDGSGAVTGFNISEPFFGHTPGTTIPARVGAGTATGTGFTITTGANNRQTFNSVSHGNGIKSVAWTDDYLILSAQANNSGTDWLQVYQRTGTNGEVFEPVVLTGTGGSGGSLGPTTISPNRQAMLNVNHDGTMLIGTAYAYTSNPCRRLRITGTTLQGLDYIRTETADIGYSLNGYAVSPGYLHTLWGTIWPTYMSGSHVLDVDY